jgi:hypothetical protein
MTLDDIAESIGTVHDEQHKDDGDREATDSTSDDLQQRSMDEYDGGWSADH